jgi:hypothetical protein
VERFRNRRRLQPDARRGVERQFAEKPPRHVARSGELTLERVDNVSGLRVRGRVAWTWQQPASHYRPLARLRIRFC